MGDKNQLVPFLLFLFLGVSASAEEMTCSLAVPTMKACNLSIASDKLPEKVLLKIYGPSDLTWKGLPVVYYLHGRGGNVGAEGASQIVSFGLDKFSQSEKYKSDPFLVIAPQDHFIHDDPKNSTGQDYWLGPIDSGRNWEGFLKEDMVKVGDRLTGNSGKCGRLISGTSMGAHGAIKMGYENPDVFAAIGAHSPIFRIDPEDVKKIDEDVFGGMANKHKFFRRSFGTRLYYEADSIGFDNSLFLDIAPDDSLIHGKYSSNLLLWKKRFNRSLRVPGNSVIQMAKSPNGFGGHSFDYWKDMALTQYFPWYQVQFQSCQQ